MDCRRCIEFASGKLRGDAKHVSYCVFYPRAPFGILTVPRCLRERPRRRAKTIKEWPYLLVLDATSELCGLFDPVYSNNMPRTTYYHAYLANYRLVRTERDS